MNQHDAQRHDGTPTAGRKGIPYDWQAVLAAVEAAGLDAELAALTPQLAD